MWRVWPTVARESGIRLFFDAAHAFGSIHAGSRVGGFGDGEVFSLSPTKVVVAGEGGIIATDDDLLAERCRFGRDYANPGDYDCRFVGLNARMSEPHAAMALGSLEGLDDRLAQRNAMASAYRALLDGTPGISFPQVLPGDYSTFKDFTILVDEEAFGLSADDLARALAADGVDTRRYYSPPVHRMQAYRFTSGSDGNLPVTDRVAGQVLTLPLWIDMSREQLLDGGGDDLADPPVRLRRGGNPRPGRFVEGCMTKPKGSLLAASMVVLALAASACAGLRTEDPGSGSDQISHPTGSDAVVLRVDMGGGFVPFEWTLRRIPSFSLFGDGSLLTEGPQIEIYPGPALPSVQVAHVSEEGIQAILQAARTAGLFGPDAHYDYPCVADANTTTFTVVADGSTHVISAYALEMGGGVGTDPGPATDEEPPGCGRGRAGLDRTAPGGRHRVRRGEGRDAGFRPGRRWTLR